MRPGPVPLCNEDKDSILVGFQDHAVPLIVDGALQTDLYLEVLSTTTHFHSDDDHMTQLSSSSSSTHGRDSGGQGLLSLLGMHFASMAFEPRGVTSIRSASPHDTALTFLLSHFTLVHEFGEPGDTAVDGANAGRRQRRASRPSISDSSWTTTEFAFDAVLFDSLQATPHGGASGLVSVSEGTTAALRCKRN